MFIASVMLSSHLIPWHPLLLPSIFPSIRDFSNESSVHMRWPKYWSFSFSISVSSEYSLACGGIKRHEIEWDHLYNKCLQIHEVQLLSPGPLQCYRSGKWRRISKGDWKGAAVCLEQNQVSMVSTLESNQEKCFMKKWGRKEWTDVSNLILELVR